MLRWLKRNNVHREFTDKRECRDCVRVVIHTRYSPLRYGCELDDEVVDAIGRCEAFFEWSQVGDQDLPTSAHEKAALLALKQSTYRDRRENYT